MLISDPSIRQARAEEKRAQVLRFLADEKWSTLAVLERVIGGLPRQVIRRTMRGLEQDGLVRRHTLSLLPGNSTTLWAITHHGLVLTPEADPRGNVMTPTKVTLSRVPHQLLLQETRLLAEQIGWTAWVRGEALMDPPTRPDAVAVRPDGRRFAIEAERNIKSRKRYQDIILCHLKAIRAGEWAGVYYVCPESVQLGLERLFHSIEKLPGGKPFDAQARRRFRIMSLSAWPPNPAPATSEDAE